MQFDSDFPGIDFFADASDTTRFFAELSAPRGRSRRPGEQKVRRHQRPGFFQLPPRVCSAHDRKNGICKRSVARSQGLFPSPWEPRQGFPESSNSRKPPQRTDRVQPRQRQQRIRTHHSGRLEGFAQAHAKVSVITNRASSNHAGGWKPFSAAADETLCKHRFGRRSAPSMYLAGPGILRRQPLGPPSDGQSRQRKKLSVKDAPSDHRSVKTRRLHHAGQIGCALCNSVQCSLGAIDLYYDCTPDHGCFELNET